MPVAVYVLFDDCEEDILPPTPCAEHAVIGATKTCTHCRYYTGIVAVRPQMAKWAFADAQAAKACQNSGTPSSTISVRRFQIPLAPASSKTWHTLQGHTADPGLLAHFELPLRLPKDANWLAYYVLLSRVRSFKCLLSNGLPPREVLEGGPPEQLMELLEEVLGNKVARTHAASKLARQDMQWPLAAQWNLTPGA